MAERRKWTIDLVRKDEMGRLLLPKTIKSEPWGYEVIEINDVPYILVEPGIAVEKDYCCPNCQTDRRVDNPDCDMLYGYNYAFDFCVVDPAHPSPLNL